jgi:ketosteroid isomerase-like protein
MNVDSLRGLMLGLGLAAAASAPAQAPAPVAPVPAPPSYLQSSEATRQVGERYFAAYIDRRWDELEPLLAAEARFLDPTAEAVFGKVEVAGKRAVIEFFRANYANLRMAFTPQRVIHSGAYALFEGELHWHMVLPQRTLEIERMPFVTVLRIEDGRVAEHRDYADYRPFLAAERATRPAKP